MLMYQLQSWIDFIESGTPSIAVGPRQSAVSGYAKATKESGGDGHR
jgi:hypothetical protein